MPEREYTYFQLNENSERIPAEQEHVDALRARQAATSERLQEIGLEVPPGVPMDEVRQYFVDMGAYTSPIVLFDSSNTQAQALLREVVPSIAEHYARSSTLQGSYYSTVDITFVAMDRCQKYDPTNTNDLTRTIVHEQGHSTAKGETYIVPREGTQDSLIVSSSSGYVSRSLDDQGQQIMLGYPLNEAYAGLYESHFVPSSGSLGTPAGVFEGDVLDVRGLPLPHEILTPVSPTISISSGSVHATIAVELLAVHDPQLIELVLEGGSSAAKEQELREHLETLEREYPGVTSILLGPSSNTVDGLAAAGRAIVKYFPNARDIVIEAHDQAREIIQRKIQANRQKHQFTPTSPTEVRESITIKRSSEGGVILNNRQELAMIIDALSMAPSSVFNVLNEACMFIAEARFILEAAVDISGSENYGLAIQAFDEAIIRIVGMCDDITVAAAEIENVQQTL